MGLPPASPPSDRPPLWRRLPVILGVALLLRLSTALPTLDAALFSDEIVFHQLASHLAAGEGYVWEAGGRPTSWRPPLWPATLALLYRVTGPAPAAARLLQVGLGTLLVFVIFQLAVALRPEDERVPAVSGWWAAISPTLLYYSHAMFGETLFGILCGAALLALLRLQQRSSAGGVVAAGSSLGLACLVRGTSTVLYLPLALGWLIVTGRHGRRRNVQLAIGVGLVTALMLLPWVVRNYRVHGGLVIVDSNGPQNLLMGNHERTPFWRPWEAPELADRPAPRVPAGAGEVAAQRASLREALAYMAAHPLRCAVWFVMKSANLWGLSRGLGSGVASGLYGDLGMAVLAPAALWDGLDGLALLLLGVAGMAIATRRDAVGLQLLLMGCLTFIHGLAYGHSRYRFMALLMLFGFAAMALLKLRQPGGLWAGVPPHRRRLALVAGAALIASWLYDVIGLELLWRLLN